MGLFPAGPVRKSRGQWTTVVVVVASPVLIHSSHRKILKALIVSEDRSSPLAGEQLGTPALPPLTSPVIVAMI